MDTYRRLRIRQDLPGLLPLLLQLRSERNFGGAETKVLNVESGDLRVEFFYPCAQGRVQPGSATCQSGLTPDI